MFYIDKYDLTTLKNVSFNKDNIKKLQIMSKDNEIPHLIFYGPRGSGKKSLINMYLELLYDKSVNNTIDTEYNVTGSGNNVKTVLIKQSNYHIVIEPNNTNFDRYLIQDVVKEYAKRIPLNVFASKKNFKIVLINNIDNLSYYAQTSLRRTLEKYSNTCRFIMWSESLSKVITPLKSRCYCLKIEGPNKSQLIEIIETVCKKENIEMTMKKKQEIIDKSENNIKKTLWLLQLYNLGINFESNYDEVINIIVTKLIKCSTSFVLEIRDLVYKVMITNIDGTTIIKDIVKKILETDISIETKINIIELAANYEHNLIRGRREIIHLESFIIKSMEMIYKTKN